MIFHPKLGQKVRCNYKDKRMPCQGIRGEVVTVSKGPGPRNVLIKWRLYADNQDLVEYDVIPRGNLVAI